MTGKRVQCWTYNLCGWHRTFNSQAPTHQKRVFNSDCNHTVSFVLFLTPYIEAFLATTICSRCSEGFAWGRWVRHLVHEVRDVALVSTRTIDDLDAMKTPVVIGMNGRILGAALNPRCWPPEDSRFENRWWSLPGWFSSCSALTISNTVVWDKL